MVPHEGCDVLVLAWHHDHCASPSPAQPTHDPQRARECWLACATELLGDECDPRTAPVFDTLDTIGRASALVEMVHARMRPSRRSCTGHSPQEAFNLIMFSHNHHRDKSGKRPGKAPFALLTSTP